MIFAILLIVYLLFSPFPVSAIYDPLSVPNNKYGIHIADTNDVRDASQLVNSSGGAWGYITIVIPDTDIDNGKWQEIFNIMRRNKLIPLVRIATHVEGDSWVIPQEHNIQKWANFLDSLNWPIENRYVIVFNEPNHAKEWGNSIDPEGYASLLTKFSAALKAKSSDFFVLPAGLDASANTGVGTLDEEVYIKRMLLAEPEVFKSVDGWSSHSYPNPAFSGSPYAYGRGTLATFLWEQAYLQSLGLNKTLPVFITETGWQHAYGKYVDPRLLSPEQVALNTSFASQSIWQNQNIVAITPFVFNYQDYPFDHFSFKKLGSSEYYAHYLAYQQILKTKGEPKQLESVHLETQLLPNSMVMQSTYTLEAVIQNTGQSIISLSDGYLLTIRDIKGAFQSICDPIPKLEPNEKGIIRCTVKSPNTEGKYTAFVAIAHGNKEIPIEQTMIRIIPPPSAQIHVTLGANTSASNLTATVLVYDVNQILLHKFTNIPIHNGNMNITGLYQVIPGRQYRIVVLVSYYLPRQEYITMNEQTNNWLIRRLYPFDFNKDGTLTIADIIALIFLPPRRVIQILMAR